jgi:DNA-binding NarL/FixJ family response regulator
VTLRVLIADDERLVRAGLRMVLASADDMTVVGEAADGVEAVRAVERLRPDVVIVDVRMPRMDGVEATRRICARQPAPAVLVVTTFDLDQYVHGALRAGAGGFLLKDAPEERLLAALRTVHTGAALLDPAVTLRMVEAFAPRPAPPPQPLLDQLTAREREVLVHVARGASNDDIACALHIGEATVKTHVSRLLTKLGVVSRTQAVVFAYESGIVVPGGNR